jgi:hypothetical protein
VSRYLDFFDPEVSTTIQRPIGSTYARGARRVLVAGVDGCNSEIRNILNNTGFASFGESRISDVQTADISGNDLLVINSGSSKDVSRVLHDCIGKKVEVIAPITDHYISKRTVFLMSIPKAGTHMVIRLLDLMGLARSPDRAPRPGTWTTPVGYEYHAPCRELLANDWFDPVGRQLLFRSPAIFVYRHPLDIVVSERDWFVRPEHAFSGYLNCCEDESEQLDRLIADQSAMGTIRDRINRYAGWMSFNNVIPVSYEELVGSRGGGSDVEQADAIWALQLKLHIAGSPEEYGARLYDPASTTFSKGRIGRHTECFTKRNFSMLDSLPQDFMHALGYARGSRISSKVLELRRRPLVVKELSPELLATPRLVREGIFGWNIIEMAGKYYPIRQGKLIMSAERAVLYLTDQSGFATLSDAVDALINSDTVPGIRPPQVTGTELVVEGYCGFNVVRHGGEWYGFDQATGPTDIDGIGEAGINDLKTRGVCVTGESAAEVKMEILRLVMQIRERRESELLARLEATEAVLSEFARRIESGDDSMRKSVEELKDLILRGRHGDGLVVEGYCGFNVVRHGGEWYGFDQATGPIEIASLSETDLGDLKTRGVCVTGESTADVKAEILRLVMKKTERRDLGLSAKQEAAEAVLIALDRRIDLGDSPIREAAVRLENWLKDLATSSDDRLGEMESRLDERLAALERPWRQRLAGKKSRKS